MDEDTLKQDVLENHLNETYVLENVKLNQIKRRLNEVSWNDSVEKILKSLGEKASGNKSLHFHESQLWETKSNRSQMIIIILSTLCGMVTIANTQFVIFRYIISVLNIGCAILTSLSRFYKPDEKAQIHYNTSHNYGIMHRKLALEMSLSRIDRENADVLCDATRREYDRIQNQAPAVSNATISWFETTVKKDINVSYPDVLNPTTIPIEINVI